jgi:hypothetical protein
VWGLGLNSTGSRTLGTLDSATGKLSVSSIVGNGDYLMMYVSGGPIDFTNRILYSYLQATKTSPTGPYNLVGTNILYNYIRIFVT